MVSVKLPRIGWSERVEKSQEPWWDVANILTEEGGFLLTEDGGALLLENEVSQIKVQ